MKNRRICYIIFMIMVLITNNWVVAQTPQIYYSSKLTSDNIIYYGWAEEVLYYNNQSVNSSYYYEFGLNITEDLSGVTFNHLMDNFDTYIEISINGSTQFHSGLFSKFQIIEFIHPIIYENGSNHLKLQAEKNDTDNIKIEDNRFKKFYSNNLGTETFYEEKDVETAILYNRTITDISYESSTNHTIIKSKFYQMTLLNSSYNFEADDNVGEIKTKNSETSIVEISYFLIYIMPIVMVVYKHRQTNEK